MEDKHFMMSENKKIKIFFGSGDKGSFIDWDYATLLKDFKVRRVEFFVDKRNIKKTSLILINIFINLIWCDIIFIWFADNFSYYIVKLSKIFHKKSVVVVGGFEVAKIPELDYGMLNQQHTAAKVRYIFENSSIILPVDDGLRVDAMNHLQLKSDENVIVLPTGFNKQLFSPLGEKEQIVLTVGSANSVNRLKLKGIDTFVKTAQFLPDIPFIHIGQLSVDCKQYVKKIATENVTFLGYRTNEEIIKNYQKAKVYCQLSLREGLPTALCEAMLCGCIPVGTNVQGVKTAIGDTGFYVIYGNPVETSSAIRKALQMDPTDSPRKRIMTFFPIQKREEKLKEIIVSLKYKEVR